MFKGDQLSWLERVTDNDEVGGSSPSSPTNQDQFTINFLFNM